MIKLAIQPTQTITSDDLEIFVGDLPLVFEAIGNIGGSLQNDLLAWSQADYPAAQTAGFIPRLFLSVSQNGDKYPLTGQAEAEALRQAVGDDLLKDLVESYWNYRYRYFKKKRLGSGNSSPASDTGNGNEPTP